MQLKPKGQFRPKDKVEGLLSFNKKKSIKRYTETHQLPIVTNSIYFCCLHDSTRLPKTDLRLGVVGYNKFVLFAQWLLCFSAYHN